MEPVSQKSRAHLTKGCSPLGTPRGRIYDSTYGNCSRTQSTVSGFEIKDRRIQRLLKNRFTSEPDQCPAGARTFAPAFFFVKDKSPPMLDQWVFR